MQFLRDVSDVDLECFFLGQLVWLLPLRAFDQLDLLEEVDDALESRDVILLEDLHHLHATALDREEGSHEEVQLAEETDLGKDLGLFETGFQREFCLLS